MVAVQLALSCLAAYGAYLSYMSPTLWKSVAPTITTRPWSSTPGQPHFTYRLAAASAGKKTPARPPKPGRDFWNYSSVQTNPSPPYLRSTKRDSGEDAFFATTIGGSKNDVAFGLADGVGGWQDSGVDPSDFSHGLCGFMAGTAQLHEGLEEGGKSVRPRELMQTAYEAVLGNPRILAGGSTATVGVVGAEGGLEAANLGDSGFLILGPGKVIYRSAVQTHAFNTPYQLSKVPPKMQAQYAIFGGSSHFSETPTQADVTNHQLRHGDIVLFATDGVWDNLSAQDTLGIVTKVMQEKGYWFKSHNYAGAETMLNSSMINNIAGELSEKEAENYLPSLLAAAVASQAKLAGLDPKREGPFAKEVKKNFPGEAWEGGKPDDIAVVVCVAVRDGKGGEEKPIKAKL